MEATSEPERKGRSSIKTAGLLVLFIALFTAVAFVLKPPADEGRQTVFLHADGMVSLGSRKAAKFDPSEIAHWPRLDAEPYYHFVLDAPAGTLLSAWSPTVEQLAALGYSRYQLRVGGSSLNFHIPGSGTRFGNSYPTVIDLRRSPTATVQRKENPHVLVLIDRFATCDQVLEATRPHCKPGVSLVVGDESVSDSMGTLYLLRHQGEDREHERLKPSPMQSLAERVRNLFRR